MRQVLNRLLTRFPARQRATAGQELSEWTILQLSLALTGWLLLLLVGIAGTIALPAFGHEGWVFAAVALLLGWCVLRPRRLVAGPARLRLWLARLRGVVRKSFLVVLVCWLALIGWSKAAPGGPPPPAKPDAALVRVLTWNIHVGHDDGPFWERFDWPRRKQALEAGILQADADILCVQEAAPEQVAFLEQALPGHGRIGVGRDDGRSAGEHCAIYYRHARFQEIDSGTFWLEEPSDRPRPPGSSDVKRICTWARLRERDSGRVVRVYNAHSYLTEDLRGHATQLILDHIAAGEPTDTLILAADFNASPAAPSRQRFHEAGLVDSAPLAGRPTGVPTFHLYGIGLRCLDGILVSPACRVHSHCILKMHPWHTFPSDHFGVMADVALTGPCLRCGLSEPLRRRALSSAPSVP